MVVARQIEALHEVVARARSDGLVERLRVYVEKGGRSHGLPVGAVELRRGGGRCRKHNWMPKKIVVVKKGAGGGRMFVLFVVRC